MGRNEPRSLLHAYCNECGKEIARNAEECACGAARPEGGWSTVAQLRVMPGRAAVSVAAVSLPEAPEAEMEPEDDEDEPAAVVAEPPEPPAQPDAAMPAATPEEPFSTEPTAPLRATAPSPTPAPTALPRQGPSTLGLYLRLGSTFAFSFSMASGLVLVTWFGFARPDRPEALRPEPIALVTPPPVVVPTPVQLPVEPTLAVAEDTSEDALADAEPVAEPEPAPPPVRRRRSSAPRTAAAPQPVLRAVVPEPTEPVAEAEKTEAPPAPPAAPRPAPVPDAVAALSGSYVGRSQGRPLSMELQFRPRDELVATMMINDGETTETVAATGTWTLADDGSVTVALVENGTAEPKAYSGTVDQGGVAGRVFQGGRGRGRFNASR